MKRHTRSENGESNPPIDLGSSKRKQIKYGPAKTVKKERSNVMRGYMIDYTSNSNLHGLKYIGEKERTFVEKVFWTSMFICCVVLCAHLIHNVYVKWKDSPVIIGFDENLTPVWKIPYPAVTVCSETKAMRSKYNFTEYYHLYANEYDNLTDTERFEFEDISMVCDQHLSPSRGRKFGSGLAVVNNLKKVCPDINDFFYGCVWEGVMIPNCSDVFSPLVTEQGLCYTFNTLGAEEVLRLSKYTTCQESCTQSDYEYVEKGNPNHTTTWTLEKGYPEDTPRLTYPRRGLAPGHGPGAGLTFVIKASEGDLDHLCRGPVPGYKIFLHSPAELPTSSHRYYRAPLSQEVLMSVKPKIMTTTDGLLDYDPNKRKCYFSSERYLRYFRVYTQANCEMECLSNFTYALCDCVHFGMLYGPNMTVCNAGSIECVRKAYKELATAELYRDSPYSGYNTKDELSRKSRANSIALRCTCLPACKSIAYEADLSQADLDWRNIYKAYRVNISSDLNDTYMTRVFISFKEAQFLTSQRSELYGQTDFLANCGGLLGLFMGFSVLSLVEIFYFFTLRLICLFWKKRSLKRVAAASAATNTKLKHLNID